MLLRLRLGALLQAVPCAVTRRHRALQLDLQPLVLVGRVEQKLVQPKKVATCWCHAATGGTFSPRYSPVP